MKLYLCFLLKHDEKSSSEKQLNGLGLLSFFPWRIDTFLHFSLLCLQELYKYLSSVQKLNALISLLPTTWNGHTDTKHHGQLWWVTVLPLSCDKQLFGWGMRKYEGRYYRLVFPKLWLTDFQVLFQSIKAKAITTNYSITKMIRL